MSSSDSWRVFCGLQYDWVDWDLQNRCLISLGLIIPSHTIVLAILVYLAGRYPKPLGNPVTPISNYCCQTISLLLLSVPLVKYICMMAYYQHMDEAAVGDIELFLVFVCWSTALGVIRRFRVVNLILRPCFIVFAISVILVIGCQVPLLLGLIRNDLTVLENMSELIFYCVYELFLVTLLLGLIFLISLAGEFHSLEWVTASQPLIQSSDLIGYESFEQPSNFPSKRVSNAVGVLFFWHAFYLLKRGYKTGLQHTNQLLNIPKTLSTDYLLRLFTSAYNRVCKTLTVKANFEEETCFHDSSYIASEYSRTSLINILLKCFGLKYLSLGILRLTADSLSFFSPFLLGKLITFVSDPTQSLSHGAILAAALFGVTFFAAMANAWFTYLIQYMTMQVKAALISAIYAKTLVTPHSVWSSKFNAGQVMTFLTTDSDRTANILPSIHSFWSLPFQLGVAFYLLYAQIGLYFIAGVVLAVVMIPINFFICRKIMQLTQEMLAAKDNRVKVVSEMLQGIKAVKLCAWESVFKSKIEVIRSTELWRCLKGRKLLDAFCVYFWATTPLLMQLSTFITFIYLSGQELTSTRVYTSIALFNMLISPLNAFPWVVNGVIDGVVSIRRLEKFFRLPQYRTEDNYSLLPRHKFFCFVDHSKSTSNSVVVTKDAVFSYPTKDDENNNTFKIYFDHGVEVPQGSLVCVMGSMGSGKSSLLLSLAGEMYREFGSVFVQSAEHAGLGFAPQQPWLVSGTIRHNILMHRTYCPSRYDQVIQATALGRDFAMMNSGDLTEVGEDGCALSGGQRQRVALARAIYDTSHSVYLLDDPISSVDIRVGQHIFQECILRLLIGQQGNTVIMATNRPDLASRADLVIHLSDDGHVEAVGRPEEVLKSGFTPFKPQHPDLSKVVEEEEIVEKNKESSEDSEEKSQVGSVKLEIWMSYAKAAGYGWCIFAIVSLILMQGSRNAADIWLAHWLGQSESLNQTMGHVNGTDVNLAIYGGIGGANSLFALLRAFSFAYVGLYAAGVLHNSLLGCVLDAPIGFFESTPIGRVLNRFTADVWAVDDSVPFELNILLAQLAGLAGTLATITYAAPITLAVVAPLAVVYYFLQRFYRFSSRDLKRLQLTSQSPIYSHATSYALTGLSLPVIRGLVIENSVLDENKQFIDANQRVQLSSLLASQWLGTNLQLMGVMAVGACCGAAILEHWRGGADPALVGLSLSYALSLTGFLSGLISSFTETERQMISVERVKQYIDGLPKETDYGADESDSRAASFSGDSPAIEFDDVYLRYRSGAAFALNGIRLKIQQGERVAIVGRTGAGKSSLFTALFRLIPIERGRVLVGGRDSKTLSKKALRSLLASVPQEPIVFSGSIRFNLDPGNSIDDESLLEAIESSQLKSAISRIRRNAIFHSDLDVDVGERGAKLSLGERQLLCVARALASSTSIILCADEPTSTIDSETEAQVIKALCSSQSTKRRALVMIAHRLANVLNPQEPFDRIVVIDAGNVVEQGPPQQLLANPVSALSLLINATG